MIMNGCDRLLFSRRCFISLQCFFPTFPVGYILGRPLVVFSSVVLLPQRGSPFFQGRIGTLEVFSKERSASRVLLRWTAKPTTEHSIFICTLAHLQCFCCSHLSSFSIHHFLNCTCYVSANLLEPSFIVQYSPFFELHTLERANLRRDILRCSKAGAHSCSRLMFKLAKWGFYFAGITSIKQFVQYFTTCHSYRNFVSFEIDGCVRCGGIVKHHRAASRHSQNIHYMNFLHSRACKTW